ncbi:helix-turn-helix domain-containing protein [Xylophilus sp. Kf1]|nr:helix-turn-helix domain-containing protein [Xylophilus sp. Kf1]
MNPKLLQTVGRYLAAQPAAAAEALVWPATDGLQVVCARRPTEIAHAIYSPLICLVLQGRKQMTVGANGYEFGAGDSLVVTADVPNSSQILQASAAQPYLSVVVELQRAVIAELALQMQVGDAADDRAIRIAPTDAEVADVVLRLVRLADRPQALPVLRPTLMRELHYWLLAGRHGAAIRRLGWPDGHSHRVGRAVAVLRAEFAAPLPVERLAALADMSLSSFHHHFRAVTSLSPLQFQKQLRLIEARRLMASEGATASRAAYAVGYESVPQFTREYGRMFGQPPGRDSLLLRAAAACPAP